MSILRRVPRVIIRLIILLTIYTVFYGPPFGNTIANYKIKKYASAMYEDFQISEASYNSITNRYYAELTDKIGIQGIRYNIYDNVISDDRVYWSMYNKLTRIFL